MKNIVKTIAFLTATLIAFAPLSANAGTSSFSDGVFSWPTDYKSQKTSEAISTFDGKIKKLETAKSVKDKSQIKKRK